MKKTMAGVFAICVLLSGTALAGRMHCERCIILSNGDMTCYNCTFD